MDHIGYIAMSVLKIRIPSGQLQLQMTIRCQKSVEICNVRPQNFNFFFNIFQNVLMNVLHMNMTTVHMGICSSQLGLIMVEKWRC